MSNGWTGGQYSVLRAMLGAYLLLFFAEIIFSGESLPSSAFALSVLGTNGFPARWLFPILGCSASALLLLGRLDRSAAWLLFFLMPWQTGLFSPAMLASPVHLLLALHLFVSPAPYGSLAAAGRPDPGGSWRMPPAIPTVALLFLAATYLSGGLYDLWSYFTGRELSPLMQTVPGFWLGSPQWFQGSVRVTWTVLALSFTPLALFRKTRPFAWMLFFTLHLVLAFLVPGGFAFLIIYGFAFEPRWLPARVLEEPELIFYDGECGLCHRAVRFVLSEDRDGSLFRLSPLQSETFKAKIPQEQREDFPDSSALLTGEGVILIKSEAALIAMIRLGGLWRVLGTVGRWFPLPIRDLVYDLVARVRLSLFKKPENVCPILPPRLRSRFMF